MNLKINGFRAGIMASMLAIAGVGCKRVPYKPIPKELITAEAQHVVDSFYNLGKEISNNPEYKPIHRDTIRFFDVYIQKPHRLHRRLVNLEAKDKYPTDENDFSYLNYKDPRYIVSGTDFFTKDGKKQYIAVTEYDKK